MTNEIKKITLRFATGILLILSLVGAAQAACPVYETPSCSTGEKVVIGKDSKNCPMPMCQRDNESCPNYTAPICAAGEHLATSIDPANKKCRKPVCEKLKAGK